MDREKAGGKLRKGPKEGWGEDTGVGLGKALRKAMGRPGRR